MGTDQFVASARSKHGDTYDYSNAVYVNATTKVEIVCPKHGRFVQLPRKHLAGSRCPVCARQSANDYRKVSVVDFIKRATEHHGETYDYSKVDLSNLNSTVAIRCREHGWFNQRAMSHLKGHGCRSCGSGKKASVAPAVYDTSWFVDRAAAVHGGVYDYNLTKYKSSATVVDITCRQHGPFRQTARDHLNGYGCPKCGLERLSRENAKPAAAFVAEATARHTKYDYSMVSYVNQDVPVCVICPEHGQFYQKPRHHLRGQGCPACGLSSGQLDVLSFLVGLGYNPVVNDRSALAPYELDLWLPQRKFAVEYNGLYWHSYGQPETTDQIHRHARKQGLAENSGIVLFQVFEHEWLNKRAIVESMIKCRLGLCIRVGARKLALTRIDDRAAAVFYNSNHLMGHRQSRWHLALLAGTDILSCMSFSTHHKYGYELTRYAAARGVSVVGGPSRLFGAFRRMVDPAQVFSYADNRYASGMMYKKIGFAGLGVTKPNYYYVDGLSVHSRHRFQKHALARLLPVYDASASESTNMFNNGYRRLWDAGHRRFLWSSP